MRKKSDKIVILFVLIGLYIVLSWLVPGGDFNSGQYVAGSKAFGGIYDVIAMIYSAFYYKITDILYILCVGGCYGVLGQTKWYRKLVDKTADFILDREGIAMAVITLIMGIIVSISNQVLLLFCVVPFIISIFLRNGCKKLTAISAAFGGLFIGMLGLTFGTYGVSYLMEKTGVAIDSLMVVKVIIFIIAYVLFNFFAILYLNKYEKSEDGGKYDILCPEPLDESNLKKRRQTKIWPIIVLSSVMLIILIMAYINWNTSFNIAFFTDLHTKFKNSFQIEGVPVFSSIIGNSISGFGEFQDLMGAIFFVVTTTTIIALLNKMSINSMIKYFGYGAKKVSKVAFIYGFVYVIMFLGIRYAWPFTTINGMFGNGEFNILIFLIISLVSHILFCVDMEFLGYSVGPILVAKYINDINAVALFWRVGGALAMLISPTSFLLLMALSYLDVPYSKWIGYIWKFIGVFIIAIFIVISIVIYV